jgi:hypothetical protein
MAKPGTAHVQPTAEPTGVIDRLTGGPMRRMLESTKQDVMTDPATADKFKRHLGFQAQVKGAGQGFLTSRLTGAGPALSALFGALGGATTTPKNVGGAGTSSAIDAVNTLFGSTAPGKATLAARGAAQGLGYIMGQQTSGETPSRGEAASTMLLGTLLPPALKGGAEKVVSNPVSNSLFMKSRDAVNRALQAIGLQDVPNTSGLTADVAQAADTTQRAITGPVLTARTNKLTATQAERTAQEAAAAQNTKVMELKGARDLAQDVENQKRQRSIQAGQDAVAVEKTAMPQAQAKADEALAAKATDAGNTLVGHLRAAGWEDKDAKGVVFLLKRKNPALLTRVVNEPTKETLDEAAHFYSMDRADNVFKRLRAGRNPNNYEEFLDPETARIAKAVLDNPNQLPPSIIEKYKAEINKLVPKQLGDIDNVLSLHYQAQQRKLININPPATPEAAALGGLDKTYFAQVKPGTAAAEIPAEVQAARAKAAELDSELQQAQGVTRQKHQELTEAKAIWSRMKEAAATAQSGKQIAGQEFSNASAAAKEQYANLGVTAADVNKLRRVGKDSPEVFFGRMIEQKAIGTREAKTALAIMGNTEEARTKLAGGALQRFVEGAKDETGSIQNFAARWEKAKPIFRELLGDEAKVDKLGHFVDDIQKTQERLNKADHGVSYFFAAEGLAAVMRFGMNQGGAAAAMGVAGPTIAVMVKWPKFVEGWLKNPNFGKEFLEYSKAAGTVGGLQAARNLQNIQADSSGASKNASDLGQAIAKWFLENGSVVNTEKNGSK